VVTPSGKPGRPWLAIVEDDYSQAVAGYAVNLGAPSALTTALAFRQAIWRKDHPDWHVCGIPEVFQEAGAHRRLYGLVTIQPRR
jgi:putative transposase